LNATAEKRVVTRSPGVCPVALFPFVPRNPHGPAGGECAQPLDVALAVVWLLVVIVAIRDQHLQLKAVRAPRAALRPSTGGPGILHGHKCFTD
jgi:hypothetical protein